jgi:hypothetical protein
VAGFISEWWPGSNRNGGRHQIGIPGRIASEFARTRNVGRRSSFDARQIRLQSCPLSYFTLCSA